MNQFRDLLRRNSGVLACFYVLAQLDVYVFVGFPETIKQVVGTTLLAGAIALLCLALPVLFVRFRRRIICVEMFVLAFFEVVELVAKVRFDTGLNGDWLLLVLGTSWQEVEDCLMTCSIPVVMLATGVFSVFCFAGWRAARKFDCVRPKSMCFRILLMLALIVPYFIMVSLYRYQGNETTYSGGFGAMGFLVDTAKMCKTYLAFNKVRTNPAPPALRVSQGDLRRNPIYVFGIGESLTRNHMSLYGYGRETTPELDAMKDRLVVYSDFIARYRTTEKAVAYAYIHFDESGLPDYTFPQAVEAAGYDCVRLSMQKSWSARSLVDGVLFCGVESYGDYLKEEGSGYDDKLLPLLQDLIDKRRDRPLVVFLHFRGSHFEYGQRYPKDSGTIFSDEFKDALNEHVAGTIQKFNRYDNSVHYSDMIMSKVIDILSRTRRPSFFAFCSDHGESPSAFYPRESTSRDVWEIPLFFWFSSEYRALYPQKVASVERCKDMSLQADQLFGGFLSLLHIAPPPPPRTRIFCRLNSVAERIDLLMRVT